MFCDPSLLQKEEVLTDKSVIWEEEGSFDKFIVGEVFIVLIRLIFAVSILSHNE